MSNKCRILAGCSFRSFQFLTALVFFLGASSFVSARAFRITRPYPGLPPEFRSSQYYYARVGYGGGVFAVFGDFFYCDSLFNPYGQVYLARVTLQGQVLDTLPILVSLKMDGRWRNQNMNMSLDGPPYDGENFHLIFHHDSLPPQPIYGSRIAPGGPLVDSIGIPLVNIPIQINNGCAFGDSTYLMAFLGRNFPSRVKLGVCAARIRKDRTTPDSVGFIVDFRDTSIIKNDNSTSVAYNGTVFLVVWGEWPGSVWAARVTEAGVVLDTVPILVRRDLATEPMVVSDGRDFFISFFMRDTLQNCRYVAGARVSDSGVVLDTIPIRISRSCSNYMPSFNGLTFNGWDYQAVWTNQDSSEGYVHGARINPSGVVKDTIQPRLFPTSPRSQIRPSAASAPGGRVLVAWANNFDGQVYGAFLDTTGREVGVEELQGPPGGKSVEAFLAQPLPNPMRNQGEVAFSLPAPGKARLAVYDALGRKIKVLLDEEVKAGSHRVRWDASDNQGRPLPSGVYFLRLEVGKTALTRKVVVIRRPKTNSPFSSLKSTVHSPLFSQREKRG